jgi:hypothetical protein
MKQFREQINQIELIESTKYYTEFIESFRAMRDSLKVEGKEDLAKLAQYEIEICSLIQNNPIISDNTEARFISRYGNLKGREWPDIKEFKYEQFVYYEERLLETSNLFLKMRYSDFLFEYGEKNLTLNKYQISKYLLGCLLEICNYFKSNKRNFEYVSTIARLAEVSLLMGNKDKIQETINLIFSQLEECNCEKDYSHALEFSKITREILNYKSEEIVVEERKAFMKLILNNAKNKYLKDNEYNLHKLMCEEIIKYKKLKLITDEQEYNLQLEIGKSYELESEYQHGREKKSLINKAHYLEEAMRHYANIGLKEKVDEMKKLIKETYNQIEQSDEMKAISFPIEIPHEFIEKQAELYVSTDIQDSLDKIAHGPIVPETIKIAEQVRELSKEFPLQSLISKSILSSGKKVDHSETEEDLYAMDFNRNYMLHLDVSVELLVKKIFNILIQEHNFNTEDIMTKFNRWGLLSQQNYHLIEAGITRFFEEDYISAIHILVPQFESTLRNLFVQADFATTSIKKGTGQHEETFNQFLNRKDVKDSLGENIHKLIQIVMVEQSGLNLRNEIAHGLISFSSITESRCILVILLYLILTRYEISIKC